MTEADPKARLAALVGQAPSAAAFPDAGETRRSTSIARRTRTTATSPPTWRCSSPGAWARSRARRPQAIVAALGSAPEIAKTDIAGPGFINFTLSKASRFARGRRDPCRGRATSAAAAPGEGRTIMVEFVSANPTGPLHVGHGRQAALGDAISTLLEWQRWKVLREFYYNDAGNQIANLALSVQFAHPRGAGPRAASRCPTTVPRRLHPATSRATTSAEHPADAAGDDLEAIRKFAVAYLRGEQDADLRAFGVKFDSYFLESSLYTDGKVEETVTMLVAAGQDLRIRRRAVAEDHRLRRRQGPRDAQVRRHLHVLRARRGLPPHQVPPRLRARP